MKYRILISFGLLFASILIGGISYRSIPQTGLLMSVYGWVKNIETGNSIQGVRISLFKVTKDERYIFASEGTSDRNGFYKIKPLEPGLYNFSIETPGGRTVFIGRIAYEGGIKDYYKLEIKEGRNTNLNIFLGESLIPDIKRQELKDGREINFTMIIAKEEEQAVRSLVTSQQVMREGYEEYNGLKIMQHINIIEDDDIELDALYDWQYEYPKTGGIFCKEKQCIFPSPKGKYRAWIKRHTLEWFKKNILPNKSDECVKCLMDCLEVHEKTHHKLAINNGKGIVKECWDEFLKKLRQPIPCCEVKDCENKYNQFLIELEFCIQNGIVNTENQANQAQRDCEKNCSEKCK